MERFFEGLEVEIFGSLGFEGSGWQKRHIPTLFHDFARCETDPCDFTIVFEGSGWMNKMSPRAILRFGEADAGQC